MAKGRWFLRKVSDNELGEQLILLKEGVNMIGRGVDNCIKCKSVQVSRKHCSINVENGKVTIQDLKSFNGTFIGDSRVLPMRELSLISGDLIGLGAASTEPLCDYVYQLQFEPNVSASDTCAIVTCYNVSVSSTVLSKDEKPTEPAGSILEQEDVARKRSAISPPPVPLKIAKISDSGGKVSDISEDVITGEVSSENRNSLDKCVTICVGENETADAHCKITDGMHNVIVPNEDRLPKIDSPELKLSPTSGVNKERGSGQRDDDVLLVNTSLMNSSIFSQAEEDIVEIVDSDEEFPCSQLFEIKEEVEEVNVKKEATNESRSDDSDVEIIEDECSFFEEHFSQSFCETSPSRKDKTGDSIKVTQKVNANKSKAGVEAPSIDDKSTVDQVNGKKVEFKVNKVLSTVDDFNTFVVNEGPIPSTDSIPKLIQEVEVRHEAKKTYKSDFENKVSKDKTSPLSSSKEENEKKFGNSKRFTRSLVCEALPLPPKKVSKTKGEGKNKSKTKNQAKFLEKEEPVVLKPKRLVEERKLKLKELTLKETNEEAVNLEKEKNSTTSLDKDDIKKAPNCAKMTEKNRGSFLMETTNVGTIAKKKIGNKNIKKCLPSKSKDAAVSTVPIVSGTKDTDAGTFPLESCEKTPLELPKTKQTKSKRHVGDKPLDNGVSEKTKPNVKIMNRIPKKKGKKCVHFNDENLVQIKEYECEGNLNKIEFKVKDMALKPNEEVILPLKKFIEGTPVKFLETVYDMCKWNVVWLEECKKVEGEPPVGDLMTVSVMKEQFKGFDEYQRSFITLQLYELWATTVHDCDNSNAPSFSGFISKSDIIPLGVRSNKLYQRLQCCAFVSKEDVVSSTNPKSGDFVIVQIVVKNDNIDDCGSGRKTGNMQPKNIIFNAFGYVMDHSRVFKLHHVRDPLVHNILAYNNALSSPGSKKVEPKSDSCIYFTLMIRPRDKKMDGKCHFRIKTVHNLIKDTRYFDALGIIPFSPLCHAILDPSKYFFLSPTKSSTLFWQVPLNDSQMTAVLKSAQSVISKIPCISLIHGPPGTGKTSVIISLLLQILYSNRKEGFRKQARPKILLCAPSNTAVDELVLRLMDVRKTLPPNIRFKLVRHGRRKVMHPTVADISTESLAERELLSNSDPQSIQTELSVLRAEERAISMTLERGMPKEDKKAKYMEKYLNIQQQIIDLEKMLKNGLNSKGSKIEINNFQFRRHMKETELRVLQCADIVATTLASSFTHQMKEAFTDERFNKKFTCCIIDEATQATEPESLIPLLLSIDNIIMVGDPQQLSATVLSQTSKDMGLGKSLFARLYNNWVSKPESTVYSLNIQYRMHPEIAKWPSLYFYSNSLQSAPTLEEDRNTLLLPYSIMTHRAQQDTLGESNTTECKMVCNLVKAIHTCAALKELSIGVIVPYQKQKNLILSSLTSMRLERPNRIMVQTIDSYQGQEKDIILLSCVRTEGIGFLADPQRLNVAITRAKSSLIIIGNFASLQASNSWQSLLLDAKKRCKVFNLKLQNLEGSDLLNLVMKKSDS